VQLPRPLQAPRPHSLASGKRRARARAQRTRACAARTSLRPPAARRSPPPGTAPQSWRGRGDPARCCCAAHPSPQWGVLTAVRVPLQLPPPPQAAPTRRAPACRCGRHARQAKDGRARAWAAGARGQVMCPATRRAPGTDRGRERASCRARCAPERRLRGRRRAARRLAPPPARLRTGHHSARSAWVRRAAAAHRPRLPPCPAREAWRSVRAAQDA
jgi:hypothetical protein